MTNMVIKDAKPLHKMPRQIAGSLHLEWKRCGRKNCHCAAGGRLHGPYGAYHWRESGVQKKKYVAVNRIVDALITIQERRDEREDLASVRRELHELNVYCE